MSHQTEATFQKLPEHLPPPHLHTRTEHLNGDVKYGTGGGFPEMLSPGLSEEAVNHFQIP